eukprot:7434800-Alexandrium_andersonii.AAC.1
MVAILDPFESEGWPPSLLTWRQTRIPKDEGAPLGRTGFAPLPLRQWPCAPGTGCVRPSLPP